MTEVWHLHIYSLLLASLHTGKKLPDVLFTHHLLVLCKFLQVLLKLDLHIIILCKDFQLSYKRSSDIYNGTKSLFQFLTSHRIQTGTQVLSCNKSKLKLSNFSEMRTLWFGNFKIEIYNRAKQKRPVKRIFRPERK